MTSWKVQCPVCASTDTTQVAESRTGQVVRCETCRTVTRVELHYEIVVAGFDPSLATTTRSRYEDLRFKHSTREGQARCPVTAKNMVTSR
jgi:uncharacterized Zn finger protein